MPAFCPQTELLDGVEEMSGVASAHAENFMIGHGHGKRMTRNCHRSLISPFINECVIPVNMYRNLLICHV